MEEKVKKRDGKAQSKFEDNEKKEETKSEIGFLDLSQFPPGNPLGKEDARKLADQKSKSKGKAKNKYLGSNVKAGCETEHLDTRCEKYDSRNDWNREYFWKKKITNNDLKQRIEEYIQDNYTQKEQKDHPKFFHHIRTYLPNKMSEISDLKSEEQME